MPKADRDLPTCVLDFTDPRAAWEIFRHLRRYLRGIHDEYDEIRLAVQVPDTIGCPCGYTAVIGGNPFRQRCRGHGRTVSDQIELLVERTESDLECFIAAASERGGLWLIPRAPDADARYQLSKLRIMKRRVLVESRGLRRIIAGTSLRQPRE